MERDYFQDANGDQQFWNELRDLLKEQCPTHESIDDTLRSWLGYAIGSKGEHVRSEYDIARCSYTLISSPLFEANSDYIRRQIIFGLLQDDDPDVLHFIASFLLFDGQEHESTFELMSKEGAFPRLISLISSPNVQEDAGLHRLLMDLFYEMGRMQKIHADDLMHVDDDFIISLFQIIEELSDDVNDPYHYPVIRLLLVLNEQFMVSAHDPDPEGRPAIPLTNKVIKVLSSQGSKYRTFGENIILLLNRESETSLQLLTLKLLYLLFTTPSTHEYFYTNDLRVLVDILIRNLLDLPEEASALRHTYLRVFYPLLAHTQLRHPPNYKRDEIRRLLAVLGRGQSTDEAQQHDGGWRHFDQVDETTKRLVTRCSKVTWLRDEDMEITASPIEERALGLNAELKKPPLPSPRKLKKRNSSKSSTDVPVASAVPNYLGDLEGARESSLSVLEVAAQREKPGVMTPSRKDSRAKPPPPKARRSGWTKRRDPHIDGDPLEGEGIEAVMAEPEADSSPIDDHPTATTSNNSDASAVKGTKERKPPPMPKARRWRGHTFKKDDEGNGHMTLSSQTSLTCHDLPAIPPPPPIPVLGAENSQAPNPSKEKESVSSALHEVRAEAMTSLADTLEKQDLNATSSSHQHDIPPTTPLPPPHSHSHVLSHPSSPTKPTSTISLSVHKGSADVPSISIHTPILTPPAAPPPRGVRGPEFQVSSSSTSPSPTPDPDTTATTISMKSVPSAKKGDDDGIEVEHMAGEAALPTGLGMRSDVLNDPEIKQTKSPFQGDTETEDEDEWEDY